jgi:hypothetical protein
VKFSKRSANASCPRREFFARVIDGGDIFIGDEIRLYRFG